jgi:large subunit ribosomal protein L29
MKVKEIRQLAKDEIEKKVEGWEEELFNLRFQAKMGQLANPLQLRLIRKDVAKAKTVLTELSKVEKNNN